MYHLNLTSNGSLVNIASSTKYLGVIIANDFNGPDIIDNDFKDHITGLEKRVARSVGILSKLVHIFPQNTMLRFYYALVRPLILHGIII